ncbi:hypothetical protein KY343_07080 [Candidatus Woesearchaeota archaeon]|nr:hypothetical protein [Candidatus Woesearchaeota archaeon]
MNFKNKEIYNKDFKIDNNIAYFIGILHSDGCIYNLFDKKRDRKIIRLNLTIGKKSISMALKFKKILFDYFNRTVNLRKVPNKNSYVIQTSINRIKHVLKNWNEKIPLEIKRDSSLFGAYLAGLIDGDGYIKLKNNTTDRIVPQCIIKIASDHPMVDVKNSIISHIGCNVHFEYKKGNKGVDTCFYISKKSIGYIKNYIFPHIVIDYKLNTLEKFFNNKNTGLPGLS